MALDKAVIPIPFSGGINRRPDDLQLNPPFLASVVNGCFDRPGRIQKRNGYTSVSNRIMGGTDTIDAGYALSTYRDELLAFDQNSAYSYAADANKWVDKGNVVSTLVTKTAVDSAASTVDFQFDAATHPDGMQCYVFVRARSFDVAAEFDVYVTILDSTTGQTIRQPEVIATQSVRPKVIVRGNQFYVYVYNYNTQTIQLGKLGTGNPLGAFTTFTDITSVAAGVASVNTSRPAFDVTIADSTSGGGDSIYLAFNNADPAGGMSLWWFTSGVSGSPTVSVDLSGDDARAVTVFFDPVVSGPVVGYADDASVFYAAYTGDLSSLESTGPLQALSGVVAITGTAVGTDATDLRFFYSTSASADPIYTCGIDAFEVDATGLVLGIPWTSAVVVPEAFLYGVKIASKAFARDGVPYLAVTFSSALQPTYFVVNGNTGAVVMRALRGVGSFPTVGTVFAPVRSHCLPAVQLVATDTFRLPVGEILGLPPDAGDIADVAAAVAIDDITPIGISALTLEFFDAEKVYQSAEIANNLLLSGGAVSNYDGENFVEHGFNVYPEGLTVSGLSAGSTFSYSYIGVYEWTDNQNNLFRSSPSVPVVATSSAAISGANDASIVFPTLRLTQKTPANGRGAVMLALYRTENNGTVYYRLPYTSTNINTTTTNSAIITDATEDADLVDGIRIYSTGALDDVIENVPPPPTAALVAHGNRLFALDSTNPLSIAYTKEVEPGIPAEFAEGFVINVNPKGGNVTGIASMDDKLIVFKETSIYAMTGSGPDALGLNDDYSTPVFVTGDCGCVNIRSIVSTPEGLMFQSRKGIKMLSRALEVVDIGSPVFGIDTSPVTSAVLMPSVEQVRFTLTDGTALMFDYNVSQWSQFTGIRAVDSVIWNDLHVYLRSDGTVLKETPDVYTDNGSFIPLLVKTAWLKIAGLQGFQRLWKFLILGTYESPHSLQVSIAHDFNPNPTQVTSVTPTTPGTFGSDATFGDSSVFGGEYPLYQWRVNLTRQTSQAVQITVQDTQSSDYGQGMTLSGITLEAGVKQGSNKIGATRSIGP